jgi:hypothetical protein
MDKVNFPDGAVQSPAIPWGFAELAPERFKKLWG